MIACKETVLTLMSAEITLSCREVRNIHPYPALRNTYPAGPLPCTGGWRATRIEIICEWAIGVWTGGQCTLEASPSIHQHVCRRGCTHTHEILASLLRPSGTRRTQWVRALVWACLPKEACAKYHGPLWHSSKHSKPIIDLATARGTYYICTERRQRHEGHTRLK